MASCDMTTEGGGWTLCGNIDEVTAGDTSPCVDEGTTYVDAADMLNVSFCEQLFNDTGAGEMMIHNLTEGDASHGEGDRVFIDWSGDPITPGSYDDKAVTCYHLDGDGSTVTVYPDCQYSSHIGDPWQQALWSFTDGLNNGYSGNYPDRVILGPTFDCTAAPSGQWYSFGGGTNTANDAGNWMNAFNVGNLYMR